MPPRARIDQLLDKGSPFLELSTLAGLGMHDDDGSKSVMGGGAIAGIGYVQGIRCMISASDSGIKGGTIAPMGLKKNLRVQEICHENKLPKINLIESGGANLKYQSDIFVEGGRGFYNQARMSAMGIPQIAVVHGSSTAGGAYVPGMSDYTIMVKGAAASSWPVRHCSMPRRVRLRRTRIWAGRRCTAWSPACPSSWRRMMPMASAWPAT